MKILVGDDSQIICDRIKQMLLDVNQQFNIFTANSAPQIMAFWKKEKPDLLILDIRMPDVSGIEVLKEIQPQKNGAVIIMFTNLPLPSYKKKCLDLGADYFLDKSSEFEKLTEIIEHLFFIKNQNNGSNSRDKKIDTRFFNKSV